MTADKAADALAQMSPEARRAAEAAAEAAGMTLDAWLNQLIKYVSAMERREAAASGQAPKLPAKAVEAAAKSKNAATPPQAEKNPATKKPPQKPAKPAKEEQAFVGSVTVGSLRQSRLGAIALPTEQDIVNAADAWRRTGAIETITARRDPANAERLEVIIGADRWQAARRLKLRDVPIVIKDMTDVAAVRAALIDELKRKNVSPIREAGIYRRLMAEGALSVERLAKLLSKTESDIKMQVRVLDLPDKVRDLLEAGALSALHGRALLDADDPESVAREVVGRGLDIFQTEQLLRQREAGAKPPEPKPKSKSESKPKSEPKSKVERLADNDNLISAPRKKKKSKAKKSTPEMTTQMIERHLSRILGLKVTVTEQKDAGVLTVHYAGRDQLSGIVSRLNRDSAD